jgi:hypothetical protein
LRAVTAATHVECMNSNSLINRLWTAITAAHDLVIGMLVVLMPLEVLEFVHTAAHDMNVAIAHACSAIVLALVILGRFSLKLTLLLGAASQLVLLLTAQHQHPNTATVISQLVLYAGCGVSAFLREADPEKQVSRKALGAAITAAFVGVMRFNALINRRTTSTYCAWLFLILLPLQILGLVSSASQDTNLAIVIVAYSLVVDLALLGASVRSSRFCSRPQRCSSSS